MSLIIDTTTYRSKNFEPRPKGAQGTVAALVLHTGEGTKRSDLTELTNNRKPINERVSAHYYVDRETNVYELVNPAMAAWHAGESFYQGRSGWNDFSVGIETEHKEGQDWPPAQKAKITELFQMLIARYNIVPSMVVAHRWIAPRRRTDPTDWPNDELRMWINGLYVHPSKELPGLSGNMPCGQGFYDFYYAHGGFGTFGYAMTPETKDVDTIGRECTWMRLERAILKYVYGEGVHLALLVEAAAKHWIL